MSLINCPECGNDEVSDRASECPNCGFPILSHLSKERLGRRLANLEQRSQEWEEEEETRVADCVSNARTLRKVIGKTNCGRCNGSGSVQGLSERITCSSCYGRGATLVQDEDGRQHKMENCEVAVFLSGCYPYPISRGNWKRENPFTETIEKLSS